jgi:predicted nucleic acid-binding protein
VISLLDVNLLVALFDEAHVHHLRAHEWLKENRSKGWATCPITQNGCLRILSQPSYPGAIPVADITRRLRQATKAADLHFLDGRSEPLRSGAL